MRTYTLENLASIVEGTLLSDNPKATFTHVVIDSRKISRPRESVFFALVGPRHDGHNYIQQAHESGIQNFVVEKGKTKPELKGVNYITVNNSLRALQHFARFHRAQYEIPVIGITGSNGKTIVKEWLAEVLTKKFNVVRSPRSFNSQVGVPLSVLDMGQGHEIGIFEAGISLPGEMSHLAEIILPTLGIFTNLGSAHDAGFDSRIEKCQEKLRLFRKAEVLVYRKDHSLIDELVEKDYPSLKTFTWGYDEGADIKVISFEKSGGGSLLSLSFNELPLSFRLSFTDEASFENCMHCIAAMLYLKLDFFELQRLLEKLHPVPMRLELKQGVNGCQLIDDTYNNDLKGIETALDFQAQQHPGLSKTVIVSDVLSGDGAPEQVYPELAKLIRDKKIHRMIGVGEQLLANRALFPEGSQFYLDTKTFLNQFRLTDHQEELILIKGARPFEFERIVKRLQRKIHRTVLEINLSALTHNLNFYRSRLKPGVKIMVMVKAFAYGSGNAEVAQLLQFNQVDYLAVAYPDEGVELRENGVTLPIMVMNASEDSFEIMLDHELEPEVYSMALIKSLHQFLKEKGRSMKVHLKFDTGMHRLGFIEEELEPLLKFLRGQDKLEVVSAFTHMAAADEREKDGFTERQMEQFKFTTQTMERHLNIKPLKHAANSAGIVRFPEYQLDMVRLGIGLYGVGVSEEVQAKLRTVGTLKTIISQIREVPSKESVGYGRKGMLTRDSRIATLPVGYADGYDRRFSNGVGKVFINGHLAPVVGNVCMDMIMVDVTDIAAQEGDEVEVFGKNVPVHKIAQHIGTIPYELMTDISERVKRIFYSE